MAAIAGFAVFYGSQTTRAETVRVGGTGLVNGLFLMLADAFARHSPEDKLELIGGLGSGGGIAAVDNGALSVAVSSRPLTEKEIARGLVSQRFLETPFIFVANHVRQPSLSFDDLVKIYDGSNVTFDDGAPLRLVLRPRNDSHTLLLADTVPGMKEAQEKARQRQDLPTAATDQDNLELIGRVPGAFGGMALSQQLTELNTLQVARLDGILPSVATMKNGTWRLRLPAVFVTTANITPGTKRFIEFARGPVAAGIIEKAGAVRTAD